MSEFNRNLLEKCCKCLISAKQAIMIIFFRILYLLAKNGTQNIL